MEIGAQGRGLQCGPRVGEPSIEFLICEHPSFEDGELLKDLGVLDTTRGYPISAKELTLISVRSSKPDVYLKNSARARRQGHRKSWRGIGTWREGEVLTRYAELNEGYEVVLNATGGADGPDYSSGKVPRARSVYEDQLVMVTPIQGVLDSDVSHTLLYYNPFASDMGKLGDTREVGAQLSVFGSTERGRT
jgi:hypothetical protein